MKGYQMVCRGGMVELSGTNKIHSRKVFLHHPTEEEQKQFKDLCCMPKNDQDLVYLDSNDAKVTVLEVEIID